MRDHRVLLGHVGHPACRLPEWSLYVELAVLDDAGTQLSFTNDLVSSISPDESATLVFENTEIGPHEVRLSKVQCL